MAEEQKGDNHKAGTKILLLALRSHVEALRSDISRAKSLEHEAEAAIMALEGGFSNAHSIWKMLRRSGSDLGVNLPPEVKAALESDEKKPCTTVSTAPRSTSSPPMATNGQKVQAPPSRSPSNATNANARN